MLKMSAIHAVGATGTKHPRLRALPISVRARCTLCERFRGIHPHRLLHLNNSHWIFDETPRAFMSRTVTGRIPQDVAPHLYSTLEQRDKEKA